MKKYCKTCDVPLDFVLAIPNDVYSTEHLICPICYGTYNIIEVGGCNCKYAHVGSCPWPTLQGRLNNPITSRYEGLKQMKDRGDILTEDALKQLELFYEKDTKKKSLP